MCHPRLSRRRSGCGLLPPRRQSAPRCVAGRVAVGQGCGLLGRPRAECGLLAALTQGAATDSEPQGRSATVRATWCGGHGAGDMAKTHQATFLEAEVRGKRLRRGKNASSYTAAWRPVPKTSQGRSQNRRPQACAILAQRLPNDSRCSLARFCHSIGVTWCVFATGKAFFGEHAPRVMEFGPFLPRGRRAARTPPAGCSPQ